MTIAFANRSFVVAPRSLPGTSRYQANTETQRVLSFFVLACSIISRGELNHLSFDDFVNSLASIAGAVNA